MSLAGERMVDDHEDLHRLLEQLKTALREVDGDGARARLDLFWARLAVHIRAEHLRLFPAVIKAAPSVVAELREDHDFFMRELALAISTMPDFDKVLTIVKGVEERLASHNRLEESEVYSRIGTIFSEDEQAQLASQIEQELTKRPPRFAASTWIGS